MYEAKLFTAPTAFGTFKAAGTLCGCVDFVVPTSTRSKTYTFTIDEARRVVAMLQDSIRDVVDNSDSDNDPRLVEPEFHRG